MSVEVVDLLEVVEVDHQHGDMATLSGCAGQEGVDRRCAAAPIEATCQGIDVGEQPGLSLGAAAFEHLALKVGVAPPSEDHQGDVEQDGAGQQVVRRLGLPEPRHDDPAEHRAARADEQDDRGDGDTERDQVALGGAKSPPLQAVDLRSIALPRRNTL